MLATIWAAIVAVVQAIVPSLSTTWVMSGIKAVVTDVGKLPKWVQFLMVAILAFLAVKIFSAIGVVLLKSVLVEFVITLLGAIGIYKLEQDFLGLGATTTTTTTK